MFNFFRKYQYYFFLVISVVIITSFTFFGTYSTLSSNSWREQIAFTAVDGSKITRMDVDDLTVFLATDSEDKLAFGGAWGPNFLNDGVIRKDFLETGMAEVLASAYMPELESDILRRLEKEKRNVLYTHPQAKFIGMQKAWEYFSPETASQYESLQNAKTADQAFNAKAKLYLSQKSFPPGLLRQVIRYQEKQHAYIQPDPDLDRTDLSLFGYHTTEDWFGPHFTRLVSQFIINTAIIAEQKGYTVTRAEALADLERNAELSFEQNQNQPNLGVRNAAEYMDQQLHRLNVDKGMATKLWRQVMLFRRYFHDVGGTALADTLVSQTFHNFTKEGLEIEVYRLPNELRFGNYATLQKFEVYLDAISKRKSGTLELPTTFLTAAEIEKTYPELVQKRYLLEIAEVDKKVLQSKVGIKDMWNWEVEDKNWEALKKKFPDLGVKKDKTREERFAALDGLDQMTRAKVDAFAKESIVDSHPEWLEQALNNAKSQKKNIGLRQQGGKTPFVGLDKKAKRAELIELLDKAPLNEAAEKGNNLYNYSQNNQHVYRIKVIERAPDREVLSFAEANSDGTLDELKDKVLTKHYEAIRDKEPLLYQNSDKGWKNFKEVRDLVADNYFEKIIKALEKDYLAIEKKADPKAISKDRAASLRFYGHFNHVKDLLAKSRDDKDSRAVKKFINKSSSLDTNLSSLKERDSLDSQWNLQTDTFHLDRSSPRDGIEISEAYALPIQGWSTLKTPANGDLLFYQVKGKEMSKKAEIAMAEQTKQAHEILSNDAQRVLTSQLIKQIKAKNAISLAYMKEAHENIPPSEPQMEE